MKAKKKKRTKWSKKHLIFDDGEYSWICNKPEFNDSPIPFRKDGPNLISSDGEEEYFFKRPQGVRPAGKGKWKLRKGFMSIVIDHDGDICFYTFIDWRERPDKTKDTWDNGWQWAHKQL